MIDEFIDNPPYYGRLCVGASFGMGKSFLLRYMFIKYARLYLNNKGEAYVPILVELGKGLSDVFNGQSLDWILKYIIESEGNNKKIFIIA